MEFDIDQAEAIVDKISKDCGELFVEIQKLTDGAHESSKQARIRLLLGKLYTMYLVGKNKEIKLTQKNQTRTISHGPIERILTGNAYTKIEMWNGPKCDGEYRDI